MPDPAVPQQPSHQPPREPAGDGAREPIGGTGIDADGATVAVLSQALASGALTASELTAFCLDRIERLNPVLHAVIRLSEDAAADARASDEARASGAAGPRGAAAAPGPGGTRPGWGGTAPDPRGTGAVPDPRGAAGAAPGPRGTGATPGPLAGIPVLVKDNIAVRGLPATAGSPALAEARQEEAFCVRRLREAGAIIIGKANLSEWANFRSSHPTSGWSTLGGQTANPHALDRNPSGSSSGSAVAVAAGLVPLAVGTETDGSIVCPASACGIVGIKPTLGLVSRGGIVPISLVQDTAGPMARSVADTAALLSALAGPDPADPATAAAAGQPRDYTAYLDPAALGGARLGVWRDGSRPAGAATAAVLERALALLRDAGAHLTDPVELPGAGQVTEPEFEALVHEFKHDLNEYLAELDGNHPACLADVIDFNVRHGRTVLGLFGQELFEQAQATSGDLADPARRLARAEAVRRAREALDGPLAAHRLDAIVALTASPAWLTDYVLGDHDVFHTSGPAAVAGYPAISVPAGDVCGLPVGISFIGPPWSEPGLIALAYAFERLATARLTPTLPASRRPAGVVGQAGSRR